MLSTPKIILYQLKSRGLWYLMANSVTVIILFLQAYADFSSAYFERAVDLQTLICLFVDLIVFFSIFMVLPYASEMEISAFHEIIASFKLKQLFCFLIQDTIYFFNIFLVDILLKIFGQHNFPQGKVIFLCIFMQTLAFLLSALTKSEFGTVGILFLYSVFSLWVSRHGQEMKIGLLQGIFVHRSFIKSIMVKFLIVGLLYFWKKIKKTG